MKLIAYFLPQFHEIEENNKWWGKGFTEWTNVKKGKPLYKGHKQPKQPLNSNYYDLTNKETVIWQTELSKRYGIDGFCYYHYWFNGKKLLETPAENLLKWKEIRQNFCFCWANHDWRKTWNGSMELLIKQNYGNEEEWQKHFDYLLPFFKDERYLKIENKPILILYSAKNILNIENRINFYEKKCKENGFNGIFIVETLNNPRKNNYINNSQAVVLREPDIGREKNILFIRILHQLKRKFSKNYLYFPMKYKFEKIARNSIEYAQNFSTNKKVFLGSFVSWDSTCRHKRRGYIIESDKKSFENYLRAQFRLANEKGIEYIFINAWNEWAEGMYLEPDTDNKYLYLETIKKIKEEYSK